MPETRPIALAHELRRAPSRRLLELVIEHADELKLAEVRQALLNPYADGEVIREIASIRRLMSIYEIKAALARHPRTPEVVAMGFLPGLFWRDLMEISLDVRVRPGVRRAAEGYLVKRLSRLSVGEKMTLARRGAAPVLAELRHDPSPSVIEAVLENPRLTEALLLPMVASEKTSPRNLAQVADHPRWGRPYEVRVALSRNSKTLFRNAFEILPALRRDDLEAVESLERLSSVVRRRARELLDE